MDGGRQCLTMCGLGEQALLGTRARHAGRRAARGRVGDRLRYRLRDAGRARGVNRFSSLSLSLSPRARSSDLAGRDVGSWSSRARSADTRRAVGGRMASRSSAIVGCVPPWSRGARSSLNRFADACNTPGRARQAVGGSAVPRARRPFLTRAVPRASRYLPPRTRAARRCGASRPPPPHASRATIAPLRCAPVARHPHIRARWARRPAG